MSRHNFQVGDLVTLDSKQWSADAYPATAAYHGLGLGLVMANANTYFQSLAEVERSTKEKQPRVLVKFLNDPRQRWWPCAYLNLASGVGE